jgi:hypothetical protein
MSRYLKLNFVQSFYSIRAIPEKKKKGKNMLLYAFYAYICIKNKYDVFLPYVCHFNNNTRIAACLIFVHLVQCFLVTDKMNCRDFPFDMKIRFYAIDGGKLGKYNR